MTVILAHISYFSRDSFISRYKHLASVSLILTLINEDNNILLILLLQFLP